jgi:hypothetical protein
MKITYYESFSIIAIIVSGQNTASGDHYKRITLEGTQWSKFVYKTAVPDIKSIIECGAMCSSQGDGCNAYAHHITTKLCHLGSVTNSLTFLTGQTGQQPVYFNLG